MRQTPLLFIAALLLCAACEEPEYPTTISGTLYTDSTISTPIANDTVWFYDFVWRGDDSSPAGHLLGHAYTDSLGRFGFTFWNFDINQTQYEKRKGIYNSYLAIYGHDTLFRGSYHKDYKRLVLYLGRQWEIHF